MLGTIDVGNQSSLKTFHNDFDADDDDEEEEVEVEEEEDGGGGTAAGFEAVSTPV